MDFPVFFFLVMFCILLSSAASCDRCLHQSKAGYLRSSSAVAAGTCGYQSMVYQFSQGYVAAGSSALFRDGVGCGACFKIRCTNETVCNKTGVKVILTDLNRNENETDFVLSMPAFRAMAKKGQGEMALRLGVVEAEYKRIPCQYNNHNLSLRVEEKSTKSNNYLQVKILFQGGQTDIVAVDVAQVGTANWRFMTRDYGAVWSTSQAPAGPLQFRLVVTSGYDGKWVWAEKAVLPADWKVGAVYDAGVQITDIAQESCDSCDSSTWK